RRDPMPYNHELQMLPGSRHLENWMHPVPAGPIVYLKMFRLLLPYRLVPQRHRVFQQFHLSMAGTSECNGLLLTPLPMISFRLPPDRQSSDRFGCLYRLRLQQLERLLLKGTFSFYSDRKQAFQNNWIPFLLVNQHLLVFVKMPALKL